MDATFAAAQDLHTVGVALSTDVKRLSNEARRK